MGSRVVAYARHQDKDINATNNTSTTVYYHNITAMPQYSVRAVLCVAWRGVGCVV
jgi:hypothetical protein